MEKFSWRKKNWNPMQFICCAQAEVGRVEHKTVESIDGHMWRIYQASTVMLDWNRTTNQPDVCKFHSLEMTQRPEDVLIVVVVVHSMFFLFSRSVCSSSSTFVVVVTFLFFLVVRLLLWLQFVVVVSFFREFKMNKSFFESKYNSISLRNDFSSLLFAIWGIKFSIYIIKGWLHFSFWQKKFTTRRGGGRKSQRTERHTE